MSSAIGSNVLNSTASVSPQNCIPLSSHDNLWSITLFLSANILAHAATIHPLNGAKNTYRRMILMLIAPITAGTVAVNSIIVFGVGVWRGWIRLSWALGFTNGLKEG